MLKDAGVDKFSIAVRLQEMDPEQVETLQALFARQLAVVDRRVEEAELCTAHLLQSGLAAPIEEAWLPRLPLADDLLAELGAGLQGPFVGRDELLDTIFETSPLPLTRTLAALACVRRGPITQATVGALEGALQHADDRVRAEAACAAGHWRMRAPGPGQLASAWWQELDSTALAEAIDTANGEQLRPWAAAAATLLHGGTLAGAGSANVWIGQLLREGASSSDPDLRLSCALALPDEDVLRAALAGGDPEVRGVVAPALAVLGSSAAALELAAWPAGEQAQVLRRLQAPVAGELVEPLLTVIETSGAQERRMAARLLGQQLDGPMVGRILARALELEDADLLQPLLRARELPRAGEVLRAVFDHGLARACRDALDDAVEHGQLGVEPVRELLAEAVSDEDLEILLRLAEPILARCADRGLHHDLVRMWLDPSRPVKVRAAACWVLRRWQGRDPSIAFRMSTESVTWAFGDWSTFLVVLATTLRDVSLLREVGVYDSLAELLATGRGDDLGGADVTELSDALLEVVASDAWLYLRTAAAGLLLELLPRSRRAAEQRERVAALAARDGLEYDVRYWLDRILGAQEAGRESLAGTRR
jgi:hypothetical protein